jgi:hypothetical protein
LHADGASLVERIRDNTARDKCGAAMSRRGFEHERVLLYHSRMQHIVGHAPATPHIESTRYDATPRARAPVWSLCSPKYKFKRAVSLALSQRRRPSSAPAKRTEARHRGAKRTSAFGTLVLPSSPARRPGLRVVDVVQQAKIHKEQRTENTVRQFAQGVSRKSMRVVDERLAFLRVQKERRQEVKEVVPARLRRSVKQEPPQWTRKYQCGVWFWFDEATGEARAAPPPEKEDGASSVGLTRTWHAQERLRHTTRLRMQTYFDDETLCDLDDDASVDSTIPLGTGYVAYESSPYEEFLALLDKPYEKRRPYEKRPRPKSAPARGRR